jgi:signal transduction histidine kinase
MSKCASCTCLSLPSPSKEASVSVAAEPAKTKKKRDLDPGDRPYVEARTAALLAATRAQMERFIAWGRLSFTLVTMLRSIAIGKLTHIQAYEAVLPISISLYVLMRVKKAKLTQLDVALVSIADGVIGAIALGGNIFQEHGPSYLYLGLFRMPDIAVAVFLVTLAALRFSVIGVVASGLTNAVSVLVLATIDRKMHGSRLAYNNDEISMVMIVLTATAAVGIYAAIRMKRLLTDHALTLVREERTRRNLDEILRDSHDIRASLQSAIIDARLLERGGQMQRLAKNIHENLKNVAEHLVRVRASHTAEGAHDDDDQDRHSRAPVAMGDVLQDAVRAVRAAYPEKRIEVSIPPEITPADAVVLVAGGSRALRSVLENLLNNACEGTNGQSATRVDVELEPGGGTSTELRIIVTDDGPGFTNEALIALDKGEPFTTKDEGHGLGLDFVRRIVEESEGSIHFTQKERGARVAIHLSRR